MTARHDAFRKILFIAAVFLIAGTCFFLYLPAGAASMLNTAVVVLVIPNAPSNLSASASSESQVDLSWVDNSNNETGFVVERSTGDDLNFASVASTSPNITVWSDTGLSPNTLYYYRVKATGPQGDSLYSAEASTTTPSAPLPPPASSGGGGGGGGGGGYYAPVTKTSAIFKGIAYPGSNVTLLENGQTAAVTQAGPDARFEIDTDLASGTYNFGVWAQDPSGNRSLVQTYSIALANGVTTVVSGLFFPPTISADKIAVKKGDPVNIFGYSAPGASVTLVIHSSDTVTAAVTSSDSGAWTYGLDSGKLSLGNHTAQARAATSGAVSAVSSLVGFSVGSTNVAAPKLPLAHVGDLNGDGKINLVDFSILAFWFGKTGAPPGIDLNGDGKVDLADFSILAYYWTG